MPERYREELVRRHAETERAARRALRGDLLRTLGHLAFWTGAGLFCLGLAWHTGDEQLGWVFYWLGVSVWFGGVGFSVLAAYLRGVRRGDW